MSFMKDALNLVEPTWKKSINTSFVQNLKNGSLSQDKFEKYLEQDKIYLFNYVRVCGKAIYNAESDEEAALYLSLISFVLNIEMDLRNDHLNEENLDDNVLFENKEYIKFILDVSKDKDNNRILLVLLHCMLSYHYIFTNIAQHDEAKKSKYYYFIKDYLSDSYNNAIKDWIEFADKRYQKLSENAKSDLLVLFEQTSIYEYNFWNMNYI